MNKGSNKNFFVSKTTHRLAKISTLAVASCVLLAMINIDASASSVTRHENAVHTQADISLTFWFGSSRLAGLAKYWSTVTSPSPITLSTAPTTSTTAVTGVPGGSGTATSTMPTTSAPTGGSGGGGGGSQSLTTNSKGSQTKTTDQKAMDLIKLIETVVRPEVWRDNGGSASMEYLNGNLIVTAPRSVQEAIGGPVDR